MTEKTKEMMSNSDLIKFYTFVSEKNFIVLSIVKCCTLSDIDLNDVKTIDENYLIDNDRILINSQDNLVENGIYKVSNNKLERANDFIKVTKKSVVFSLNDSTFWYCLDTGIADINTFSFFDYRNYTPENDTFDNTNTTITTATLKDNESVSFLPNGLATNTVYCENGYFDNLSLKNTMLISKPDISENPDKNKLDIKNCTIENIQKNALMFKLFDNSSNQPLEFKSRQIYQSVASSINIDKNSQWKITNSDQNDSDNNNENRVVSNNFSLMFVGYLKPLTNHNCTFYITASGFFRIWINNNLLYESVQDSSETMYTLPFVFSSFDYVSFVIHYSSSNLFENVFNVEWECLENEKEKQEILSDNFAFSGTETCPLFLGPSTTYGEASFMNTAVFKNNVTVDRVLNSKSVIVKDSINISSNDNSNTIILQNRLLPNGVNGLFLTNNPTKNSTSDSTNNSANLVLMNSNESSSSPCIQIFGEKGSNDESSVVSCLTQKWDSNTNQYVISTKVFDSSLTRSLCLSVSDKSAIVISENLVEISQNLTINSDTVFNGNLSVNGDFLMSGLVTVDKLSIGKNHSLDLGQLVLQGSLSSVNGPHITMCTEVYPDVPLMQISSWAPNSQSIYFDGFFNGTESVATYSTSAELYKKNGKFGLNYYNGTWKNAFYVDILSETTVFDSRNISFRNTDELYGSLKISGENSSASLAFYKNSDFSTNNYGDFWKINLDEKGVFNVAVSVPKTLSDTVFSNTDKMSIKNLFSIHENGDAFVNQNLTVENTLFVSNSAFINGNVDISDICTVNSIIVKSDTDANFNETGALTVNGGIYVSKSTIVQDTLYAGSVEISAQSPILRFQSATLSGQPILGETSHGTRLIISPLLLPVSTDYALGYENNAIWYSTGANTEQCAHKWYAGEDLVMQLDGVGNLLVNGNSSNVEFKGLSDKGLILSGNSEIPIIFKNTNNDIEWSIGKDSNNTQGFSIYKNSKEKLFFDNNENLTLSVFVTITENLNVKNVQIVDSLTVGKFVLKDKSISVLQNNNQINTLLEYLNDNNISLQNLSGNISITSSGDVTVNNDANNKFAVYNDYLSIFSVTKNETRVENSLVVAQDISCKNLSCLENLSVSGMKTKDIFLENSINFNNAVIFSLKPEFTIDSQVSVNINSEKDINIKSNGKIFLDSDVVVKNLYVENDITSKTSLQLVNDKQLFSCKTQKLVRNDDFEEKMIVNIGQLNTSVNGTGQNEMGKIVLEVSSSQNLSTLYFTANVKNGQVKANHENKNLEIQQLVVVTVEKDESGNFQILLTLPAKTVVVVNISSFVSFTDVEFKILTQESVKNWKNVYTTLFESTTSNNFGKVKIGNELYVEKSAVFNTNAVFKNGICLNSLNITKDTDFSINKNNDSVLSISENSISVSKSILPSSENLNLGSKKNSWNDIYSTNTIYSKNLNVANSAFFKNIIVQESLNVVAYLEAQSLNVSGKATFSDTITVTEAIVKNNLKVSENFKAKNIAVINKASFNEISCSADANVENINITGKLHSVNDILKVNTRDVEFSSNDKSVNAKFSFLENNCSIKSSSNFQIFTNNDDLSLLSLGKTGNVVLGNKNQDANFLLFGKATISGKATFSENVVVQKDIIANNVVFSSLNSKIVVKTDFKEDTIFKISDDKLSFFVSGSYAGKGESNPTERLSISKTGRVNINNELFVKNDTYLKNIFVSQNFSSFRATIGDFSENKISSTFSVGKNNLLSKNIFLENYEKTNIGYIDVLSTGFEIGVFSLNFDKVNSVFFNTDGNILFQNCKKALFSGQVEIEDEIKVGKINVANQIFLQDTTIEFSSENAKKANISLSRDSKDSKNSEYLLSIKNNFGNVEILAAGNRGFYIEKTSGNAVFSGQLDIESALNLDSSESTDQKRGALNVKGSAVFKGDILVEKRVFIKNETGQIALEVSQDSDDYSLILPKTLPLFANQCLVSDKNGTLSWQNIASTSSQNEIETKLLDTTTDTVNTIQELDYLTLGNSEFSENVLVIVKSQDNIIKSSFLLTGKNTSDGWQVSQKLVEGSSSAYNDIVEFSCLLNGTIQCKIPKANTEKISASLSWEKSEKDSNTLSSCNISGSINGKKQNSSSNGAFLSLTNSKYTERDFQDDSEKKSWGAMYLDSVNVVTKESSNIESMSTILIKNEPTSENLIDKYALNVENGRVKISDTREKALVVSGGVEFQQDMKCNTAKVKKLEISSGQVIKDMIYATQMIGSSGNQTSQVDITFPKALNDISYTICGNVVSQQAETSDIFICQFYNLKTTGCKALVHIVNKTSWTDITLALHYTVTN